MKDTKIEWATHTFNPWEGCTKVSPGCANCYAEARNARFGGGTAPNWGPGAPRRRTSAPNWNQVRRWDREAALAEAAHWPPSVPYERPRVFCASLADWLDDEVPVEWLADLLDLISTTPHLDWLLLTKRPENWHSRITAVLAKVEGLSAGDSWEGFPETPLGEWLNEWSRSDGIGAPENVWIGTTVEDQQRADERIPQLLAIPARVRFLSCEPLLGPVRFANVTNRADCVQQLGKPALNGIHWVICGGESGAVARPMRYAWAASLRDQCAAVGVPFFFKQWGEFVPMPANVPGKLTSVVVEGRARPWVKCGDEIAVRLGKKFAGRMFDGVEHSGVPA